MNAAWNRPLLAVAIVAATLAWSAHASAGNKLVVHEWGTFTCLQDDDGRELAGVNIDDEPVPKFVHNLNPFLLNQPLLTSEHWMYRQKAAPRSHPQVTMRLETPVIYFYPPKDQITPFLVNVDVRFRGGWLTEFYPDAKADAPGLGKNTFDFGNLTPQTVGSLAWSDLKVGTDAAGPETNEHVWLAPRKVDAAGVTTPAGESEKYLFYRGVGNLRAPLRVVRARDRHKDVEKYTLYGNFEGVAAREKPLKIDRLWLADIRKDGTKYRSYDPIEATGDPFAKVAELDAKLTGAQQGLGNLKKEMHAALVAAGLYEKEATAMLSTWDRAYFQSPGMRLFFIVPREWTDHVLPLSLSTPAKIERVMMARIELITEEQHALLAEIAKTPPSDGSWLQKIKPGPAADKFYEGRENFGDLGIAIPADYQTYLKLGRFRNALVVAEERRRPNTYLTRFIETYGLHPFRAPSQREGNVAAQP
ncbi:MAG: hypothetical protein DCC68_21210 [Planctomycetota bacterium]|nr:MAG: hypothetical protein DCC68_21210 [Planctomycetota bacterium]